MRTNIIIILITVFYLLYSDCAKAQKLESNSIPRYNTDQIFPQAPNAAAFSRYGQYPVDLSSGLVKIEIPIYTIRTSQFELPITLSYHSSGIKVNDMPSSVGLGWSLNAGGMLSINVKGYNDFEAPHYMEDSIPTQKGLLFTKDNGALMNLFTSMTNDSDTQSDMYSYSVSGLINGSFTYDHKWNLLQIPETDNRIERIKCTDGSTDGFIIISDDGTKYIFKNKGSIVTNIGGSQRINSYNLTKIESADSKDYISFEYAKSNSYTEYAPSFSASRGPVIDGYKLSKQIEYSGLQKDFTNTQAVFSEDIITKIIFKDGEVIFNTSDDRKDRNKVRHTGVIVKSTLDNKTILSCKFNQSYFESDDEYQMKAKYPTYFNRLKLTGVEFSATESTEKQTYRIYYNSMQLPPYDYSYFHKEGFSPIYGYSSYSNYGVDLWGYYNGKANQHLLLPSSRDTDYLFTKTVGHIPNREISEEHMKACSIEKVIYPTGGSSIFEYDAISGGLRIGRVSSYDKEDNFLEEKVYSYSNLYKIDRNTHLSNFSVFQQGYFKFDGKENWLAYSRSIYVTNPYHFQAILGSNNFYGKVIEYFGDRDNNYGKKEYTYQHIGNEVDYNPGDGSEYYRYYTTIVDNFWKRGNLLKEETYKKTGTDYELIQRITNDYKFLKERLILIGTIVTRGVIYTEAERDEYNKNKFRWFDVKMTTGSNKLMSTTTENFRNGILEQKGIVKYDYEKLLSSKNPHSQITRKSISTFTNDLNITVYKYPFDFDYKVQAGADYLVNQKFRERNLINVPFEIINYIKKGNSLPLAIDGYFYKYKDINQLQEKLKLSTDQPFAYNGASYIDNAGYNISNKYETEVLYDYDLNNNIKQYIDRTTLPVAILWSYNYRYPIAEFKNLYYTDLENALKTIGSDAGALSSSKTPNIIKIKELQGVLKNSLVTVFNYKPMVGMIESTDPKGTILTYSYDEFNRLKDITDSNGAIINRYSYNYAEYNSSELDLILLTSSQYTQYSSPSFQIKINNGSGNYSYNWVLKDGANNTLGSATSNSFSYFFTKTGKATLSCTVKDNINSKQKIITRTFEIVIPEKLEIVDDILVSSDNNVLDFGENVGFQVLTKGGSGSRVYSWILKDYSGKILANSDERVFNVALKKAGKINVICTVKDVYTNEQASKEKTLTVGAPPSIEWVITPSENQFGLNRTENFNVLIKGGSGNFSYNWELKNITTGKVLNTGANQYFSVKFSELGKMQLICKVKDTGAEDSILPEQKILNFNIVSTPPLIVSISPEKPEYNILDRINFTPQIKDGSGNYTYSWQLKNISTGTISTSVKRSFETQFLEIGTHQLTCTVKDVTKNITKTKTYLFTVVPTPIQFTGTFYPSNNDHSQISIETNIYCSEDTEITFNLWIDGQFNNGQEALFWIDNNQFTRDNRCSPDFDGNKKCLNNDETLALSKGNHKIRIILYNVDESRITRAGISIKNTSHGTIGRVSYMSIGND